MLIFCEKWKGGGLPFFFFCKGAIGVVGNLSYNVRKVQTEIFE